MSSFVPRRPWLTGDLQTIRNSLVRPSHDLARWPGERLLLAMRDGSGDRLAASLNRPDPATGRPLALLIAGVTGCEDSIYIRASATALLEAGYPVLRLNLRGSAPSRPTSREHYHAGRSEDLRDAVAALPDALTANGLVVAAFSLGANMMLKYFGEEGGASPFLAAASISAPIDMFATTERFTAPRNAIYHRWLLGHMKREALAPGAEITERERQIVRAARNVLDYDDRYVAPRAGYAGYAEYYKASQALGFLDAIRTPTLIVHADDDPWIPADAYRAFDWHRNTWLRPELTAAGGHVGFHGRGSRMPWHDRRMLAFFEEIGAA
jgi:predicted alpha/beta-fold hydrolase